MQRKKDMLKCLRTLLSMDPFMDVILKQGDWFFRRADVEAYEVTAAWKKRKRTAGEQILQCPDVLDEGGVSLDPSREIR